MSRSSKRELNPSQLHQLPCQIPDRLSSHVAESDGELARERRADDADGVVPDLAGWRRERMNDVPETAAIELPPDWVCEILSPRSAAIDRSVKRQIYAKEGVRWLWLVEPETKTLEAFALDEGVWKLLGAWHADAAVTVVPFEAITIELAAFWRA